VRSGESLPRLSAAAPRTAPPAVRPPERRLPAADVAMLTYDLAALLGAGLSLLQALGVLAEQAGDGPTSAVLREIAAEVQDGRRFSEALGKYPRIFPPLYQGIVANGEASGRQDLSLERLAGYLERDAELRKKLRDVFLYPGLVLSMAGVVLAIFLVSIIPAFERVYHRAGAALPPLTRALLAASHGARLALPVAAAAGLLLTVPAVRARLADTYVPRLYRLALRVPQAGTLMKSILLARFTHSMAMVLQSGVPLLSALEVSSGIGGPPEFAVMVERLRRTVIQGRRLSDAMRASGWFTPMVLRMVSVGEETGRLDVMLARAAFILDREFDLRMRRFLTLLEPVLILCVGAVVAVIVLALYLPMFGLARGLMHGR
jgi:type II secretory pathway component PulF